MTSRSAMSSVGLTRWLAGAVIVTVAGYVVWDAVSRGRHVLALTASYGVTVDAPAVTPDNPTGYADGRRSLVMPVGAADTAHWIMQTQTMIATGDWRIRRVGYDNAPAGREVHWAAPFHWWLAGLAWLDHAASGRPIGQSVERAVICSGPLMLGLLLLGLTPLLFRRFSPLAALLFAIGSIATFPFYLDFVAGYADHHGVANICGLLTVLFLAVGNTAETRDAAGRWFVASGLAGGAGLWISEATLVPVLLGIGIGLVAASWLARGQARGPVWFTDPGLLRLWGWTGGGMSLAAWLAEYFPSHLGMHLEVNHPLYAAAWIGAGETLRVGVLAVREGGARALTRRDRMMGLAGAGMVVLLPVVILLTAAHNFVVADPFVWRIHSLYISEFQGLGRVLAKGLSRGTGALCLPMLVLLPPLWLAARRDTSADTKAQLAVTLVPALLACAMSWVQVRWMSLAFALSVPAMAVFFREGETAGRPRAALIGWMLLCVLLFIPGVTLAVQRTRDAAEFTENDIRGLAERDIAHWLRLRGGSGRIVVAGAPTPTTKLIYHGGLTGMGTLYWENAAGLKHAAELYAAPSSRAAREIAMRLGLTHLVYISWGAFEPTLARLQRGLPEDAPLPADTFAAQLLGSPVPPPWLRAVPFKLPAHPALADTQVRIWEVVPEQSPATALARAANYFLELGRMEDAQRLVPLLTRFEDELPAAVMLAGIASRQHNAEAFTASFGRVLTRLSRSDTLALDEHIHLVVVLAVGQRPDLAQAQLRLAVAKADERSLRQLSAGTLSDLLALGEALQVELSGPTRQLAASLLPPDQRR